MLAKAGVDIDFVRSLRADHALRQAGVTRGASLILNLPGQPKAIKETLDGVFAAVPYCIDLIGGPYLDARPGTVAVFRPKSALRVWV